MYGPPWLTEERRLDGKEKEHVHALAVHDNGRQIKWAERFVVLLCTGTVLDLWKVSKKLRPDATNTIKQYKVPTYL